jgi:hypothetical protein
MGHGSSPPASVSGKGFGGFGGGGVGPQAFGVPVVRGYGSGFGGWRDQGGLAGPVASGITSSMDAAAVLAKRYSNTGKRP